GDARKLGHDPLGQGRASTLKTRTKEGDISVDAVTAIGRLLVVGACNRSGVCSQTAGFSAHALCHWRVASCSNYLPVCSPSSGAACKRGVVLTLRANGLSKPVAVGFLETVDAIRPTAAPEKTGSAP
ncbi:hypothetical protein ASV53_24425, partial [Photobacterium sanguinicancri]